MPSEKEVPPWKSCAPRHQIDLSERRHSAHAAFGAAATATSSGPLIRPVPETAAGGGGGRRQLRWERQRCLLQQRRRRRPWRSGRPAPPGRLPWVPRAVLRWLWAAIETETSASAWAAVDATDNDASLRRRRRRHRRPLTNPGRLLTMLTVLLLLLRSFSLETARAAAPNAEEAAAEASTDDAGTAHGADRPDADTRAAGDGTPPRRETVRHRRHRRWRLPRRPSTRTSPPERRGRRTHRWAASAAHRRRLQLLLLHWCHSPAPWNLREYSPPWSSW